MGKNNMLLLQYICTRFTVGEISSILLIHCHIFGDSAIL